MSTHPSKQRCFQIPVGPGALDESNLCALLARHGIRYWVNDMAVETVHGITRPVYTVPPDETFEQRQLDKARLDWWQSQHTLHKSLQLVYVVDGYELEVNVEDGDRMAARYAGKDIRACIDAATAHTPKASEPYFPPGARRVTLEEMKQVYGPSDCWYCPLPRVAGAYCPCGAPPEMPEGFLESAR